jgi:hypothetical protein
LGAPAVTLIVIGDISTASARFGFSALFVAPLQLAQGFHQVEAPFTRGRFEPLNPAMNGPHRY